MKRYLLINLRGTSGSGKSHVAHQLLKRYPNEPAEVDDKGRPLGYRVRLPNGEPLYIVGRYTTQCGGCDGIGSTAEVIRRAERYAEKGHVFFEGLLISGGYGSLGEWSQKYGTRFIFATLTTPLEVSLARIKARREKRGNFKPLNPKNTEQKYRAVWNTHERLKTELKRRAELVDMRHSVRDVLALLGVHET